jgi:multiple sugar transport system permease protein
MSGGRPLVPAGIAFVAPALGAIAIFFVVPVVAALGLSFTDFDIYAVADLSNLRFIALENYRRLLADPQFWAALRNTAYFALVGGPLSIAVSLGAALLVDARTARWKDLFRTVLFLPVTTTLVAVAVIWRYLYHPRYGLLDHALAAIGIDPIDWLGDPRWAMPAIILMAVWKNFGFNMIVFLAGLQAIPERLYEAAMLDGAGAWRRFRDITVPMLAPTFVFVGVVTAIGYLQLFTEPYVMTRGGPAGSTRSVVLLMYEQGFRWWNMGYAAAVAVVLFAVILAATAVQVRFAGGLGGGDARRGRRSGGPDAAGLATPPIVGATLEAPASAGEAARR